MTAASAKPMQIGEVAGRTGLSLRTLRHYDEIGLLTPTGRSEGGYRLYTEDDVEKLLVIRRMKPLGYSLEEMHHVMHAIESIGSQASGDDYTAVLAEARGRRETLHRHLEMADEFIDLLERRSPPD